MTRHTLTALLGLTLGTAATLAAQQAAAEKPPQAQYIGSEKCKVCHMSKAKGDPYGVWKASLHAKAFETLASEKSLAKAKEVGISGNPQESEKCAKCHVSAWGAAKEQLGEKYAHAEGVGCEACHGPGSLYMKMDIMKSREASVKNGLIIPDEKTCTKCHNSESPFYQEFDYASFYKKIAHENPQEKAAGGGQQ